MERKRLERQRRCGTTATSDRDRRDMLGDDDGRLSDYYSPGASVDEHRRKEV